MKPNWFVALPVDAGRWLAPLTRTAPPRVRVFHPDDVHLTVAFLGPVDEPAARRAWAVAEQAAARPFPVRLGGLVALGNPRRPSALSVVIEQGADDLVRFLAAVRDDVCRAAGAQLETRPPLPHVTVARPARDCADAERRTAIEWARSRPPVDASLVLDRIALFTWATDRRERQFRTVAERRWSEPRAG